MDLKARDLLAATCYSIRVRRQKLKNTLYDDTSDEINNKCDIYRTSDT